MFNKTTIKNTRLFKFYSELRFWIIQRRNSLKEAKLFFKSGKCQVGSYSDFKRANWKHRVTYSEYRYSYEFWKLNEEQRDEFISAS